MTTFANEPKTRPRIARSAIAATDPPHLTEATCSTSSHETTVRTPAPRTLKAAGTYASRLPRSAHVGLEVTVHAAGDSLGGVVEGVGTALGACGLGLDVIRHELAHDRVPVVSGDGVVRVGREILLDCALDGALVRVAGALTRGLRGCVEHRDSDGDKDTDNKHDHHELDESEALVPSEHPHGCPPPLPRGSRPNCLRRLYRHYCTPL
ncbi:hypothetical protein emb_1d0571 [Coriobacteriaceae bacterium EMTCatB1]|nr:hypothetical protein emb_1d0571 [Coriobacteriaceae bacterium EMTCatB1]